MTFHSSPVTSTLVEFVIDTIWEMENWGVISTKSWLDPGHLSVIKSVHCIHLALIPLGSLLWRRMIKAPPLWVLCIYMHMIIQRVFRTIRVARMHAENCAGFVLWKFQIKLKNCVSSEQDGNKLTYLYQLELTASSRFPFLLFILQNWWIFVALLQPSVKCTHLSEHWPVSITNEFEVGFKYKEIQGFKVFTVFVSPGC